MVVVVPTALWGGEDISITTKMSSLKGLEQADNIGQVRIFAMNQKLKHAQYKRQ